MAVRAEARFDLRRAGELYDEAQRIAERFGDAVGVRWVQAQRAWSRLVLGQWDESLAMLDEFIAECEAGSPHYLEGGVRRSRGWIREARGDLEGALEDYERALTLARAATDPQELLPNLGSAVPELEAHGRLDEAHAIAQEVVEIARAYPHDAAWALTLDFLVAGLALEFARELREALDPAPAGPWKDLAFACLDRDFVRAAEMWAEAGSPTWEARLRLRAAEELIETGRRSEGEAELQKALAFYRSVGATFFVKRAVDLLAKAQRDSA